MRSRFHPPWNKYCARGASACRSVIEVQMLVESVGGAEFRNRHFRSAVDNTASGTQALSLAVVTFIFLAAILFLQFVNNVGSMEPYKFFHWLWSYDLGFIKRGLAGTIFELFGY